VQHCPYSPEPKRYGAEAQSPLLQDNMRKLTEKEIKHLQKNVGSILYYVRVVNMTVLMLGFILYRRYGTLDGRNVDRLHLEVSFH
jgi:hypothetical protein